MSKYAEIIERLEKAEGPDRELDRDIHAELDGWKKVWSEEFEFFQLWRDGKWIGLGSVPAYTASIDAALALVERRLPGWRVDLWIASEKSTCSIWSPDPASRESIFGPTASKETTALSILLALFRTLEAKENAG